MGDPRECFQSLLDRRQLQADAEVEARRFREPAFGGAGGDRSEPREGLHPDDGSGPQIKDRLEGHRHAVPVHEPSDLGPASLQLPSVFLVEAHLGRELVHDASDDGVRQMRAAPCDAFDRVHDLVRLRALHEVAHRSRTEHLEHRGTVLERGQGDDPGLGRRRGDASGRVRTTPGHLDVDEGHPRPQLVGQPDRLVRVAGRPDERDALLVVEEFSERDPQGNLVVRDDHADGTLAGAETGAKRGRGVDGGHRAAT